MANTLLVLDVDGVISPWFRPAPGWGGWPTWRSNPELVAWDWFFWSPEQVAALAALPVDVAWLTAWRDNANRHLPGLFGWDVGGFDVVEWQDGLYGSHAGKAQGLRRFLAGDRFAAGGWDRVVWVDDEHAPGGQLDFPAARDVLADLDHLIVGPARNIGLTVDQLHDITDWLG